MEAIEKAIRAAFERGDPEDRSYRVKVYRSAFAALERAIASSGDPRSEAAEARRKALKLRIVEIEAEFLPAEGVAPQKPAAPGRAPSVDPDLRREAGEPVQAPSLDDHEPVGAQAFEPRLEPGDFRDTDASARLQEIPPAETRRERRARRNRGRGRSFLLSLALLLVVLAAIGGGLWWAVNSDSLMMTGRPESKGDNPPRTLQQENSEQQPGASASTSGAPSAETKWVTIFTPADPTTVTTPAAGKAEVLEEDGGKLLRIRSGSAGSEFGFDVGQGILERIAGKHAVFDVVAHGEEGKETQMSVNCDLGALGQCGRKRYNVGHDRNDFLFEIDIPQKKPSGAGRITIDPDLAGKGNPLDIVEIRVSTTH